ncbi:MAG TPA: helix-turn-helix transcriptional regulator [Silvibacterium sp.]|nr:helix-turn-helix transcriptional regulator [Silvibacterium sp.]
MGTKLRLIRHKWGLTLREVKERSLHLSRSWGEPSFHISASWLARVEGGKHELTIPKLISLATIYQEPAEELLRQCHPESGSPAYGEIVAGPNTTLLISKGPLNDHAEDLLPYSFASDPPPDDTKLLPPERNISVSHYRRAIIGIRDAGLSPMLRPGSIVTVDTRLRTIVPRNKWGASEFERPIYLLLTHEGYICSWCELDKPGIYLTLLSHMLSSVPNNTLRFKEKVEVVGRVVAVAMRLAT